MQHREKLAAEDSYKRLLESLYFPDIHARQESIEGAHKETFEWIFDTSGPESRPWHSFINWLERGHGTYWISGKLGSGKSTLMNFILHDSRTETALKMWSGTSEIFMPAFFFWNPGTQLQKSLAGLLRSLVYQLIAETPELALVLAKPIGSSEQRSHQIPTWTEQRLRTVLKDLLSDRLQYYHFCIFIDGLDEFEGHHASLLSLIRTLGESTSIKFCLSSRPEQLYRDELRSSPMLRLQDLTESDIRTYVSDELNQALLKLCDISRQSLELDKMANRIVEKAEGVFLWVKLAVRDQTEGITDKDSAKQLELRLEALPVEIEALYGHMLSKFHKVHFKEAAQYLQILLQLGTSSLFGVALAVHERIDDILLLSPAISLHDIRMHCEWVEDRIAITCRGFLEVREVREVPLTLYSPNAVKKADPSDLLKMQNPPLEQLDDITAFRIHQKDRHVNFLHRTAFEYLRDNGRAKEFLETNTAANPHP